MKIDCPQCDGLGERAYQVDEMRNGDEFHGEESGVCIDCDGKCQIEYKFSEFIKDVERLINSKKTFREEYWINEEHRVQIYRHSVDDTVALFFNEKQFESVTHDLRERLEALYYVVTGEENK